MKRRDDKLEFSNRILRALPKDSIERIRRNLVPVDLPLRQVILRAGEPIEQVYFIEHGLISLVKTMEDGRAVDVGSVDKEGLVGISALHGVSRSLFDCIVQLPGSGFRINAIALLHEIAHDVVMRDLTLRYSYTAVDQIAQTAACNRLHSLEQRCARWLLIAHDAAESDTLPLTHEFLAVMLGVQRPRVSVVLKEMQESRLVRGVRGQITIANRTGLERASCECYRTIRQEIEEMLGP